MKHHSRIRLLALALPLLAFAPGCTQALTAPEPTPSVDERAPDFQTAVPDSIPKGLNGVTTAGG